MIVSSQTQRIASRLLAVPLAVQDNAMKNDIKTGKFDPLQFENISHAGFPGMKRF